MDRDIAEMVRKQALEAITSLSAILPDAGGRCSAAELESLKRGVGLAIGKIQMEVLEPIYRDYPDLDDLKR